LEIQIPGYPRKRANVLSQGDVSTRTTCG